MSDLRATVERLREHLEFAEQVVVRASDLMTVKQISKWEGCRAFLELHHEIVPEILSALEGAMADAEALRYLHSLLVDREDVRDGDDGRQMPNEAMSILTDFAYKYENLEYRLRREADAAIAAREQGNG